MYFLIISIICSVSVSILLKLSQRNGVEIPQAVAVSYPVAAVCNWIFLQPKLLNWQIHTYHWILFLALGLGLPAGFIVIGKAIEQVGMIKTDAAQRLSLFLPILASYLIFHEQLSANKIVGIALALMALLGLLYKDDGSKGKSASAAKSVGCLFGVWLCCGLVDIVFKQMAKAGQEFAPTLFVAFILAAIFLMIYLCMRKTRWNAASILSGLMLGGLNFGNILFYIKAHQHMQNNPSLVFAGMNLGVIILATLVGSVLFKEKINGFNAAGIVLAIAAICFLFYGSMLHGIIEGF
ncbi:MAG: EamA family transporter [Snodgrassella sp.]|nr:EamA family transporter [Snodgrassella sp.]